MARAKKFTNLKMGATIPGTVGPQTFPAATTWISSPVPCRHARAVIFRITSTDVNNPIQSTTGLITNDPNGSLQFNLAGTVYTGLGGGANRTDRPGGLSFIVEPLTGSSNQLFYHDFCLISILSNATTPHTGFQVDAEVFYDADADDIRTSAGQFAIVPV